MKRLENLEKKIVSKSITPIDFNYYASLPTIDKLDFKVNFFGPNWQQREKSLKVIEDNPQAFPHFHLQETSREEMRKKSAFALFKLSQKIGMTRSEYETDPNKATLKANGVANYNLGISVKNGVHFFLYLKTLFNLGTEKHDEYIQKGLRMNDVGCFGLTQLLHGSNVKDLLTEAHYDHENRQFIINSPSKDAMKFWIGAAAQIANVSVIWAQLYIKGKCFGIHAFIVPLRDKKNHKLLPGIVIGDCGPKNGVNQIDNGFMLFDHVRIPVDNLLDRISGVNSKGQFFSTVQTEEKRFGTHLAALSGGRFMISLNCTTSAINALAIATRYSCVRRQFSTSPNGNEHLLMEYPLTKRRIMPLLAQVVIYHLGNFNITALWDKNIKQILNPKNKLIQDLHAISSIIKPKSGWFAIEAIKEARQILGGHGYSYFSKLAVLYNDNDINNTWEGDNNVLYQQASKYVLDNAQKVMKGKEITSPYLQFMKDPPSQDQIVFNKENLLNPKFGLAFLQFKLWSKVQQTGLKMMKLKNEKMPMMDIWNNSQIFLAKTIALTFGDLFYLLNALQHIQKFNQKNQSIFMKIIQLWMLKVYRYDEFVDSTHNALIEDLMSDFCLELSKECLGIFEALCPSEQVIGSPFACNKGQGFDKYIKLIRNSNVENKRPEWWQLLKQN